MDRRDFLKHGALLGLAGAGCATTGLPEASSDVAVDMHAYVAQLDDALGRIAHADFVRDVAQTTHPGRALDAAHLAQHEPMIRTSLRALTITGAFMDLGAAQREHPAMQSRMWGAIDELDGAVTGMASLLAAASPETRAAVRAQLASDPHMLTHLTDALGSKAAQAGLTAKRRRHFTRLLGQIGFRLRQDGPTPVIDEYVSAVSKARRDHAARGAQTAQAQSNELAPVAISNAPPFTGLEPVPRHPAPPSHERSGSGIMTVGGTILGLSIAGGAGGALMLGLSVGTGGFFVGFGLFNITMGALGLIAGLIILIVGATRAPAGQLAE